MNRKIRENIINSKSLIKLENVILKEEFGDKNSWVIYYLQ